MVKGKYINEEARTAYKEAEKKSNTPNVKEGLDEIIDNITTVETKLVDDIFSKNKCNLPSFNQSFSNHFLMLRAFISQLNKHKIVKNNSLLIT